MTEHVLETCPTCKSADTRRSRPAVKVTDLLPMLREQLRLLHSTAAGLDQLIAHLEKVKAGEA